MRAAREKNHANVATTPVSFITVNCADVCVVRITLGFSVTASASREGSKPSLLWPPCSVPQSCRLRGNRNSTPAPTASGLRREWIVAIRSIGKFHADICGPNCLVNNVWSLVQTHIICPTLCVAKQSIFFMSTVVKHGACESDTERASPSPPCRATCLRFEHPLVVALRQEILARNCIKISHRWSPRQATSCASSSNILTVCLLGIVFGESSAFQHRVRKSAPWDALTKSIFKHLVTWKLANHQFTHVQQTKKRMEAPEHQHQSEQQQMNIRKTLQQKSKSGLSLCLKCLVFDTFAMLR